MTRFALAALWLLLLATPALAAAPGAVPMPYGYAKPAPGKAAAEPERPESPEQVAPYLAQLTDAQARKVLAETLEAEARAKAAAAAAVDDGRKARDRLSAMAALIRETEDQIVGFHLRMLAIIDGAGGLDGALLWLVEALSGGRGLGYFAYMTLVAVLLVGMGEVGRWMLRRYFADRRARRPADNIGGMGRALRRLAEDSAGILLFATFGFGVFFLAYQGHPPMRLWVTTILAASLASQALGALSRFLLAPEAPPLRLLPIEDGAARYLHRWLVPIGTTAAFGFLGCGLLQLAGIPDDAVQAILGMVGFAIALLLSIMIWRARKPVAAAIRDAFGDHGALVRGLAHGFADIWHMVAILYVQIAFMLWRLALLAGNDGSFLPVAASLGVLVLVPLIDRGGRKLLGHLLPAEPADADDPAAQSRQARRNHGAAAGQAILRLGLAVAVIWALLRPWNIDLIALLDTPTGTSVGKALSSILLTLVLVWGLWQLIRSSIDRRLRATQIDGQIVEPSARLRTLLPLFQRFAFVVLFSIGGMIVLSAIGIDIGPLLAGAGVIGLALGFGAQTLVRDIVSGVFFLMEDAFRIGEYVETGALKGNVEAITIRSLKLRHHRGPVQTVPFGELKSLINHSRDWAIYKMDLRVTYDTDVQLVKKLLKQIGQDMMADPELGPMLIEPLKSQGVTEMQDSCMIVRAKFTCKPGEQFVLRREAYRRIRDAFAANNIEFANRNVTVHMPDGAAPQAAAAAAAAAQPSLDLGPPAAKDAQR